MEQTSRELAYLQYTFSSKKPYREAIRVLPGFFTASPLDFTALVNSPKAYFAFYPAGIAASQGRLRRAGASDHEGRVLAWFICEGTKETLVRELSEEQRHLPIAAIWNHEALVHYLTQEWRPEQDLGLPPAPRVPAPPPREAKVEESSDRARHVRHFLFLYFSTARVGKVMVAQLAAQGYTVTSRKTADGTNWLVLVEHPVRDAERELDAARETLERLALEHSGEYDGLELDVSSSPV